MDIRNLSPDQPYKFGTYIAIIILIYSIANFSSGIYKNEAIETCVFVILYGLIAWEIDIHSPKIWKDATNNANHDFSSVSKCISVYKSDRTKLNIYYVIISVFTITVVWLLTVSSG